MKKSIFYLCLLIPFLMSAQITTSPAVFEATSPVTINFNKAGSPLASYTGILYAHMGVEVNGALWQNVIGSWGSPLQPTFTLVSGSNFKLDIGPNLYTYFNVPITSSITKICLVIRNATGTVQTPDTFLNVGAFQSTVTTPINNSTTLLTSGQNFNFAASNTGGNADYNLLSNGVSINTFNGTSYAFSDLNVIENKTYELQVSKGTAVFTYKFYVLVIPTTQSLAMSGTLKDGINYDSSDATKATLVLNAPFKDFVYVAGSFNNYNPSTSNAMTKDPQTGKFWLELTGLIPNQVYNYQYWVGDMTDRPLNSPALVKTADPFSTLVLSPFDDPEIAQLGIFENLPAYPVGQEREVSVLQTGSDNLFSYTWSDATLNFQKPKKKDIVFYEVLVRDFDANRSYQNLIDKIDYFKNLKINAIKIMPVMEFEGNESWGYNTVFHMALDKRYGSPKKLKEFIDLCHQNGIAVLLDIALNHVFGRSPLERMWMSDINNDGWGNGTTAENPYCNQAAMHSYNVGSDLNHFREPENLTNTYSVGAIQYWINEFKIDGYRWDLTKGFTNQCPANVAGGQESCTNGYRSDRVAKMKYYADQQWAADPNSLVVFEHLGSGGSYNEEVEWANYNKNGDVGGIMQWRKMTDPYANLLKGNSVNLSGVSDASDRFVGYAESHDEERVVYKAFTETGQTQNNLPKILQRLPAMGSVLLLVPGPKMIWHFGELGWNKSLWTCNNGTVSFTAPDCKLDTKPQPQWVENWLGNPARLNVYNNWARMINLKKTENVFENGQFSWNFSQTGRPRLDIFTSNTQSSDLSYVFVLTNFSDAAFNTSGFPFTGTWYNLMDDSPLPVTATNQNVTIEPGGFRVFGNKPSSLLGTDNFQFKNKFTIFPNPGKDYFSLNAAAKNIKIYTVTGQLIKSFYNQFDKNAQFGTSDLNNGMYLVKVTDDNNNEQTIKFIKN
jgi:1,4-alpha-glucan branching enzyme